MRVLTFSAGVPVPAAPGVSTSRSSLTPNDVFVKAEAIPASQPQFAGLGEGKLRKAIRKGQTEAAKELIIKTPALLHEPIGRWMYKTYAITTAAWQDNLELARFCLERGADPNAQIPTNSTSMRESMPALGHAVMNNSKEMAQLLLSYGANPNQFGNGYSPFMWAISFGHSDLARFILEKSTKHPVLIDLQSKQTGKTALMLAAEQDNAEMVYLLLKLGADPMLKDRDGKTALMHSRQPNGRHRQFAGTAHMLNDAIEKRIAAYGELSDGNKLSLHHLLARLAGKDPQEELIERFDAMPTDKQKAFLEHLAELTDPSSGVDS